MNKPVVNTIVSGPKYAPSTYQTVVLKSSQDFKAVVESEPNKKYIVKYDFDLGGETVTVPEGCLIEMDGGTISNGTMIGAHTILIYFQELSDCIKSVTMQGTWKYNNPRDGIFTENVYDETQQKTQKQVNSDVAENLGTLNDKIDDKTDINATFSEDGKIYADFKAGDIFYVEVDEEKKYRVAYFDGTADAEHPVTITGMNFYYADNSADAIFNSLRIKSISVDPQTLLPNQKVQAQNNIVGKTYVPTEFSGLGKKVFAKNIQEVGGVDKNIMTQAFFQDGQDNPLTNTIFVIQYDYDLMGETIEIPAGSVLEYNSGSIKNGKIILNNTIIDGKEVFDPSIELEGTCQNTVLSSDVYKLDKTGIADNTTAIQSLINITKSNLVFSKGTYKFGKVNVIKDIVIDGNFSKFKAVPLTDGYAMHEKFFGVSNANSFSIENVTFEGDLDGEILTQWTNDSVIELNNVKNVSIKNCTFSKFKTNYLKDGEPFYYYKGVVITCKDCLNVVLDGCEFFDNRQGEWIFISPYEGSYLTDNSSVTVRNCYFHNYEDDRERSNSPLNVIATNLFIENNKVENYKYKGTCFNIFGLNVVACYNVIKNCYFTSGLDTCEWGLFRNNNVEIYGNDIRIYNGAGCVIDSKVAHIYNNVFFGDCGVVFYGYYYDSNPYPQFPSDDFNLAPFGAGESVVVENNIINADYHDDQWIVGGEVVGNQVVYPVFIRNKEEGNTVVICNNSITVTDLFVSNEKRQPVYISNFRNIRVLDNQCTSTINSTFSSAYKGFLYIASAFSRINSIFVKGNSLYNTSTGEKGVLVGGMVSDYCYVNETIVQDNHYFVNEQQKECMMIMRGYILEKLIADKDIYSNGECIAVDLNVPEPVDAINVITLKQTVPYIVGGFMVCPLAGNRCYPKYDFSNVTGVQLQTGDTVLVNPNSTSTKYILVNIVHGATVTDVTEELPTLSNNAIVTWNNTKWLAVYREPQRFISVTSGTSEPSLPSVVYGLHINVSNPRRVSFYDGSRWYKFRTFNFNGSTANRPKGVGASGGILTGSDIGFEYFDTTLSKPVYAKTIANDGTVTWVDATGTTV